MTHQEQNRGIRLFYISFNLDIQKLFLFVYNLGRFPPSRIILRYFRERRHTRNKI